MKILIFGLPGSGKSTLAEPFAKEINGVWINADKVREGTEVSEQSQAVRIEITQRETEIRDLQADI